MLDFYASEVVGEHVFGTGITLIFILNIEHPEKRVEEVRNVEKNGTLITQMLQDHHR
jgi:hypothetical protein